MVEAGVPLTVVAKIVGWSASTLAKMVLRYSHFQVDTLRDSMEKIVPQSQRYPLKSPLQKKTARSAASK
jgi:hypothetical protein